MLIFPRLTQLDMTGPYEVAWRGCPTPSSILWARTLDPVTTDRGMKNRADRPLCRLSAARRW